MSSKRAHISRAVKSEKRPSPTRIPLMVLSVLVVVAVVLGGIFLLIKKPAQRTEALPAAVTVNDAWIMYQRNAVFIDIRSFTEWGAYHILNSRSIPLAELPSSLDQLPHNTDLVVVDEKGELSSQGRAILLQAGFTRVTTLIGGVELWILSGLPFLGNFPY